MNLYPVLGFSRKKTSTQYVKNSPQKKAGIRFNIFQKMEVFMSDRSKGVLFFAGPAIRDMAPTTVATFPSTLIEVSEANLRQITETTGSSATPPLGFRWETAEVGITCNVWPSFNVMMKQMNTAKKHGNYQWKREILIYMWEMNMFFEHVG